MFVGRDTELQEFQDLYEQDKFHCVIVWGRRRVGKTALIQEFCKEKEAIFFTANETSKEENLLLFSKAILADSFFDTQPSFDSYKNAFIYIAEKAKNKRIILAIDEYPYLAQSDTSISSVLQEIIDHHFKKTKLFIILCGSSLSFMENQVLGYQSPLYGRRTAQFKILPFSFFETARFFNTFSCFEKALIYGATGGIPLYLEQFNEVKKLSQNIQELFFKSSSLLYDEPSNLIKQEVRDPSFYNAVIRVIASGATRLSEIASKAGLETSACSVYLKNLIELGIVTKELPIGEKSTKRSLYKISDYLFAFWFRFVAPYTSLIQQKMGVEVWNHIQDDLACYMGMVFETICTQFLWQERSKENSFLSFTHLGRWWGTDPRSKSQIEIDIVGFNENTPVLFCECKWHTKKVDLDVLNTLVERSQVFTCTSPHYIIFSKSGFKQKCIEVAKNKAHLKLISFSDMC